MQDKHVYEYAVMRVVPRVEREEFFNVGVILYCKALRFLEVRYEIHPVRFQGFCTEIQLEELEAQLETFSRIAQGGEGSGPIGAMPLAERFRWLTATRSTVLQTSRIHPGLTHSPAEKIEQLFNELVR